MEEKNMPEKKIKAGSVAATIWTNHAKTKEGDEINFSTITLDRSYKDKNGDWQHSNSLRIGDLPKAALVLKKAYEHLVLSGQDSENEQSFA